MILLYHHIAPLHTIPPNAEMNNGWNFTISPEGFKRHLIELTRRHYKFISLSSLVQTILKSGREPDKVAAITFDDGWRDNYEYAFPVLKEFNVPACFFVTTAELLNDESDNKKMKVPQLRELLKEGMEIGSHTCNHPILTKLPKKDAMAEIINSKIDLENVLGHSVDFFAYPGGAFNSRIAQTVRDAGYVAACSVLSPAENDRSTLFWLYRSTFTEGLNSFGDWYRLSPFLVRALEFRVRKRLTRLLNCGMWIS